jgi:hypothetical protein
VTSLHRHFPWLVLSKLRWAVFCAATKRKFRRSLDWEPFYAIADGAGTPAEKLEKFGALARKRFDAQAFDAFCAKHLGPLEEVAWEYFGSADARAAVRLKVAALYPAHEVEEFTERFWNDIQAWRESAAPERTA